MADAVRTKADIEAELEAARERLAEGLSSLINEIHPRAIAHRAVADARGMASDKVQALRAQLVEPDGSLNLTRTAIAGAAVVGAIAFIGVVRSILRR